MQPTNRVAEDTVFMLDGQIVEAGPTDAIFNWLSDKRTKDYGNAASAESLRSSGHRQTSRILAKEVLQDP